VSNGAIGAATLAISDIRVFGNADGTPVKGVVVYNIRWGLAPDKLYQTYQRFVDEGSALELRALTIAQHYWFAIESFDETGVSKLGETVRIE
jgi:xylan 1,4-beta-xylosidase